MEIPLRVMVTVSIQGRYGHGNSRCLLDIQLELWEMLDLEPCTGIHETVGGFNVMRKDEIT